MNLIKKKNWHTKNIALTSKNLIYIYISIFRYFFRCIINTRKKRFEVSVVQ